MNIQPIGDRVVVEREYSEAITAGGIVLPDTAKDKPARGTGHQRGRRPHAGRRQPRFPPGQGRATACSSRPMPASEFKLGDRESVLMREEDILAIID